jgi:hypothetical protein
MKRKSKILIGSAIVFVALIVALFLARKQFVGGPGSPTVEGSRAVTDGGIRIPGWNGRVDAAEEKAGMTLDAARLVASYDKTTLVGPGKLKSTNGYYGLRFAYNTDVFVSLLATSSK